MRKRSMIISVLCTLALPGGALAETNSAQTPKLIKVETDSKIKAAVSTTAIEALSDDFTPPVLESANVTPQTVGVGDTISIKVKATDDLSGVSMVDAYLNLPDGFGYKKISLVLNDETGEWEGTYTITELDQDGTWSVEFILYDGAGNYSYGDQIVDVEVENPNGGDTEFPTLGEVNITPLSVGVNEEVMIRAKVNDNVAVSEVYAAIYTADFTGYYYIPLTYDESTQEWVVTHTFIESDRSGSWYIDIDMYDTAGNFDWKTLEEEIVLTNPLSDFTGPTIGEPTITPASASPGDTVQISVPVTDAQSDVAYVYAEFSHIDNPYMYHIIPLALDPATGEYVGDFYIENSFQSGVWNMFIHATDSVNNSNLKEIYSAFDVINNEGDYDAPVISNVQVTQGDVQVGETITVTADVSDNVGVDSVMATFYSQEGNEYVEMSYDEANDQWIGTLTVAETTAPGFYYVSISAYDTSFNYNFADAEGGFTVVNPEGDHTGPVISAVELDKAEANAGEQVTISATVTDAESGVSTVTAYYYGSESVELTYDSTQDKWIGTITVPMNVPDQEVMKINFIDAVDAKGNQTVEFLDAVSFLVHNPDGDFTAPVVDSFAMTPSTARQGDTVHFEAVLKDEKSGIKYAVVYLYNDTDPVITTIELSNDGSNDVWSADYVIPDTSTLGSYSVELGFEDNAGNLADFVSEQNLLVEEADTTAPAAPTVEAITDIATEVTGTTEANAVVTIKAGDTVIGSGKADAQGNFTITITQQTAGTTITITAKDQAGNESSTDVVTVEAYESVKIQLNGQDFEQGGYFIDGTSYVNWNALNILGIPNSDLGDGQFDIEGRNVQAVLVNGDWYIRWGHLSPGKVLAERIEGGYNFTYSMYPSVKVQLNGADFAQGGYNIDGTTYVNWNALNTLGIPTKDLGNGTFEIEGRNVEAVSVKGDWYIRWGLLSPGKVLAQKIEGGYDFIYSRYPSVKVQLNGADFAQGGYNVDGTTYVHQNALITLGIASNDLGDGLFEIEGRNVQAVSVNGGWYIRWGHLSPGKVIAQKIDGGYNFVYSKYPTVKVQLNGTDFAQGGYNVDGTTYVHQNALTTLGIAASDLGDGLFEIEGRSVQAVSVNGEWYIRWGHLSPGKITAQKISGGYNFIYSKYPSVKVQLNGADFAQGGYFINGTTYIHSSALSTLGISNNDLGNGLFEIEGRNVQGEAANGGWYIRWSQLSIGKISAEKITGGYNFIYTP